MEKEYLTEKGVSFENVFLDRKPQEINYVVEKSGQRGVPVTELTFEDGRREYVVGFDKAKLNEFLRIND